MPKQYCDYNHKRLPEYWLVVADDVGLPEGTQANDWNLVKKRPAEGLGDEGRKQVDDEGYALFRVNLPLEDLAAL